MRAGLGLTADARWLFCTRIVRMFAYGLLSVILGVYCIEIGLSEWSIGALLALTLLGDTAISLWMTTSADRLGRRKMLVAGAILMVFASAVFALSRDFWVLLLAGIIGVISPSGYEVGPFLSIEQAALSQTLSADKRVGVFAWYNLVGSFATALGSLVGGGLAQRLHSTGASLVVSYRAVVILYGALGILLAVLFARLSRAVEVEASEGFRRSLAKRFLGLHESRGVVLKLSALFTIDAFAGGFLIQTMLVYWFQKRFHMDTGVLGSVFFGANILAGISALLATRLASRIGLINTMVFTHLPSNLLLMLVPLMPNAPLAILVLLMRFAISQMDVPTRQAYTMAVVQPDERSAAAGVTGVARTIGAAISPLLAWPMLASGALIDIPLYLGGGLKIVYDLLLYRSFKSAQAPEEKPFQRPGA